MAQLNNIDLTRLNNTSLQNLFASAINFRNSSYDKSAFSTDVYAMKLLDQPSNYYFKLMFYFSNPYAEDELSSNLLGLEYNDKVTTSQNGWGANTALNYLYNNREYTRFRYLSEFIKLLSDINIHCPWYFQSITGLDTALERPELGGKEFKLEEERKKITIKCLPDALDNRIGKMLDLYRSAAFSQMLHKEVIPANLRKFDMGIFIFSPFIRELDIEEPIRTRKNKKGVSYRKIAGYGAPKKSMMFDGLIDVDSTDNISKYINSKFIELRNCEFDLNSSKTPFGELNNIEGTQHEYEIGISFDTCYERRYDSTFNDVIGDYVLDDLYTTLTDGETRRNSSTLYLGADTISTFTVNDDDNSGTLEDMYNEANYSKQQSQPGLFDVKSPEDLMNVMGIDTDAIGEAIDDFEDDIEEYGGIKGALFKSGKTKDIVDMNIYYGWRKSTESEPNGILKNMVDNAMGSAEQRLTGQLKSLLMGNLYKFSPTNDIAGAIKNINNGAIIGNAVNKVTNEIKNKVVENRSNFTTDPIKLREGKSMYIDETPVDPGQHPTASIGERNTSTFQQSPLDTNINKNLANTGNRYERNGWSRKRKGNLNDSNNIENNQ